MQRCRCAGLHHDIVPCHVGSTLTEKGHLGGNVGTGHRRIQQLAAAHADVVRNAYQQRDHDSGSCGGTGDGAQKRTCHAGKKDQHPHIVLVADDQTLGFVNQGRFGQPCTDDEHGYEHDHVRVDEAAKGLGRGLDAGEDQRQNDAGRNDRERDFTGYKGDDRYKQDDQCDLQWAHLGCPPVDYFHLADAKQWQRCVEQKERSRSSLSTFFSCTYLTANSNTQDADMADSIRGVLRRSRINRVMKIGVNDKKSVGSVKANMVVRINVIVSSF